MSSCIKKILSFFLFLVNLSRKSSKNESTNFSHKMLSSFFQTYKTSSSSPCPCHPCSSNQGFCCDKTFAISCIPQSRLPISASSICLPALRPGLEMRAIILLLFFLSQNKVKASYLGLVVSVDIERRRELTHQSILLQDNWKMRNVKQSR